MRSKFLGNLFIVPLSFGGEVWFGHFVLSLSSGLMMPVLS